MEPLALCTIATRIVVLHRKERAGALGIAAMAVAAALLRHALQPGRDARRAARDRTYVTGPWHPAGHDRAGRLYAQLKVVQGAERASIANKLRGTYLAEGRSLDAKHSKSTSVERTERPRAPTVHDHRLPP